MKPIISALGRLALIGSTAFGLATVANYHNHKGYWDGTIKRVQTVDFNMLANMLPTKLSYALQQGDGEEIQRTLNSNYGLFGLVMTDCTATTETCPNEQILFATESDRLWNGQPTVMDLIDQPYSVLTDPPPLTAENGYDHSRDLTWDATGRTNPGQVVGRVYYVRGSSPEFWPSYWRWIQKWPGSLVSDSGAAKYYALTVSVFMVGGAAAWGVVEGIFYHKRIREQFAEQKQAATKRDIQRLKTQLEEKVQFTHQLIAERGELLGELQAHRDQEHSRLQEMKELAAQQQQLLQTKLEALNNLQRKQTQSSQPNSISPELKRAIARLQQEARDAKEKVVSAQQDVERLQAYEEAANRRIQNLAQLNESLKREAEDYNHKLQVLQAELAQSQRESAEYKELVDEARRMPLNPFEKTILETLKASDRAQSGEWRILEQIDIGEKYAESRSQFTDFIVLTAYGAFVIEAKNYLGDIRAVGGVRATEWRYVNGRDGAVGVVKSCGGRNPHEQVSGYCHTLMQLFSRYLRMKPKRAPISVFGIIVFPEGTVHTRIGNRITKYSRVTTVDKLIELIERLEDSGREEDAGKASPPARFTPAQLEAMVLGKPVPKGEKNSSLQPGQSRLEPKPRPDYPQAS